MPSDEEVLDRLRSICLALPNVHKDAVHAYIMESYRLIVPERSVAKLNA